MEKIHHNIVVMFFELKTKNMMVVLLSRTVKVEKNDVYRHRGIKL